MGKINPWTQRLRELVLDGPVPYGLALSEMAAQVDPADARVVVTEDEDAPRPKTAKDYSLIAMGAHRLAYQTIWTQIREGRIERYEEDGEPMLRVGRKPWAS
jgi:hypothetical protein